MRFWTIQPRTIWDQMLRGESVRVDPDHPKYGGERPWQYKWLAAQLSRNFGGFDGGWPWWLACAEPDLELPRSQTLPGGTEQASIELELPVERYVTFPLWMWETIHTGNYLAATRRELDNWTAELPSAVADHDQAPLPPPWHARLEASWERIFDPAFRPPFWYRDHQPPHDGSSLGALMSEASENLVGLTQELRAADAVRATLFQAAG